MEEEGRKRRLRSPQSQELRWLQKKLRKAVGRKVMSAAVRRGPSEPSGWPGLLVGSQKRAGSQAAPKGHEGTGAGSACSSGEKGGSLWESDRLVVRKAESCADKREENYLWLPSLGTPRAAMVYSPGDTGVSRAKDLERLLSR